MTDILAVTTFNKEGLDLYAQKFLDTWAQNTDDNMKLLVYAEDCDPINPAPSKILILNQREALPKLMKFKKKWGKVPKANGECPFPHKRPRDYDKKFKWDAMRFANKVYAVFDACERNTDKGWVVWIDADMVVHSHWNYEQYASLFPSDVWLTYVGRGKGSQTWPECGFYGINCKSAKARQFVANLEYQYENAEDGIFKLDEWHDSYVFGSCLEKFMRMYPDVLDYSAGMYSVAVKTGGGGHPLINGVLGTWLDHLKGDRKQTGKSNKRDLMVKRGEKYWKF